MSEEFLASTSVITTWMCCHAYTMPIVSSTCTGVDNKCELRNSRIVKLTRADGTYDCIGKSRIGQFLPVVKQEEKTEDALLLAITKLQIAPDVKQEEVVDYESKYDDSADALVLYDASIYEGVPSRNYPDGSVVLMNSIIAKGGRQYNGAMCFIAALFDANPTLWNNNNSFQVRSPFEMAEHLMSMGWTFTPGQMLEHEHLEGAAVILDINICVRPNWGEPQVVRNAGADTTVTVHLVDSHYLNGDEKP